MASENEIYGNIYKLNISDNFRRSFNLLPINSSPGEYTYAVYAKERHSWVSDSFCWGSKLIDCNGKIVNTKEMLVGVTMTDTSQATSLGVRNENGATRWKRVWL